jgi:predicted amidophosphoribosyltransferase
LAPLDRRRERGRTDDQPDIERTTVRCCRHCGQDVRQEYTFCGGCARPVPR